MNMLRFKQWVVLASMGFLFSCSSGGSNIEKAQLNVIVPDGDDTIDIQTVEYFINCEGNDEQFLDNNDSFDDAVTVQGDLEVVDGRTTGGVPTDIWQAFMDLPPGPCIVQLAGHDSDGERICVANAPFIVAADDSTKVNMVLVCDVSFQAPVGMADIDATFSFVVGNFCPDLFVLNALDSTPALDPTFGIAGTEVQVRGRDGDSSCGKNCDPQACDLTAVPPTCSAGPDPGVSITLTASGGLLDCDQDQTPDGTTCKLSGNQTTTGNVSFACVGTSPGEAVTITALITDGDEDCDESKEITITCPGVGFCDTTTPGDGLTDCDDAKSCTTDSCNPVAGACVNEPKVNESCTASSGGPGTCDAAGDCKADGCVSNADCDAASDCKSAQTCNVGAGKCEFTSGGDTGFINENNACDAGAGTCKAGVCESLCAADTCPDTPCSSSTCDSSTGVVVCSPPANANEGNDCGSNGQCVAGSCVVASCTNAGDRAILQGTDPAIPDATTLACGTQGATAPEGKSFCTADPSAILVGSTGTDDSGMSTCLQADTALTNPCTDCYATVACCTINKCSVLVQGPCAGAPTPGSTCDACIRRECGPGFQACAGVPYP